ncbi:MAG TPA: DUF4397 domain-containing protein [Puia sp.]|nr:DUF4397 domain-containing protein [Puia sp.]
MRKLNPIAGPGFVLSLLLLCSCKKERTVLIYAKPDSSYLSITNASPPISNLLFYENNTFVPFADSPFAFGATTQGSYVINSGNTLNPIVQQLPYIRIPSGYLQLGFRSTSPQANFSASNYFENGASYSLFITDSIVRGEAKYVLLKDQPVPADTTQGQIRFINLSPDSPPLDLYAFLNVGANGTKVFSNCGYLPDNPGSVATEQSFIPIGAGPYYMVATIAGTYNAVLDGGLIIPPKSVITIYVKGYFNGSGANLANVSIISYQQP